MPSDALARRTASGTTSSSQTAKACRRREPQRLAGRHHACGRQSSLAGQQAPPRNACCPCRLRELVSWKADGSSCQVCRTAVSVTVASPWPNGASEHTAFDATAWSSCSGSAIQPPAAGTSRPGLVRVRGLEQTNAVGASPPHRRLRGLHCPAGCTASLPGWVLPCCCLEGVQGRLGPLAAALWTVCEGLLSSWL